MKPRKVSKPKDIKIVVPRDPHWGELSGRNFTISPSPETKMRLTVDYAQLGSGMSSPFPPPSASTGKITLEIWGSTLRLLYGDKK